MTLHSVSATGMRRSASLAGGFLAALAAPLSPIRKRPVGTRDPVPIMRLFAVLLLTGLVLAASSARMASGAAPPGPPNIVYIVTDDQDAASVAYMPRLRSLVAEQGATFRNAFCTTPICCPSQASMLTGKYAHNTQILFNIPPLGGFQKFVDLGGDRSTIATWLQGAGYRTGRVGKYLVGYPIGSTYIPPGWDDWHSTYEGFSRYFDYDLNENGSVVHYGSGSNDYMTDVLAEKALAFIESSEANDAQPFFLVFSPTAPHSGVSQNGPPTPAPRHVGAFSHLSAPRPPSFNETDVSDKPAAIQALPLLSGAQIAAIDQEYRARLESLLAVDEAIERMIHKLTALGELENTYVVFTSDNGYHLGQHRFRNAKGQIYEEDIRVPLMVRGPGVPVGVTRDHYALNIDFAPTFAELGGASPTDFMDGRSLVSLLGSAPPAQHEWRDDFLVELWRPVVQGGDEVRALRTRDAFRSGPTPAPAGAPGPAIYAEYRSGARELYDLVADPYQLESLHEGVPPGQQRRWSSRLGELAACAGGACR
jgi:N-acetylglucosamine-6-sulfatase